MDSFCETWNKSFLINRQDDFLKCPPAPVKPRRVRRPHKGNPVQLFHEALLLKGVLPGRHALFEVCDSCRSQPLKALPCSKKHLEYMKKVMSTDKKYNEVGFEVKDHYLTFPRGNREKVETLLNILRIDFRTMHITDQHNICENDDEPELGIVSERDANKLANFLVLLRAKYPRIPGHTFEIHNDQLFMIINWMGGKIMVNISSCTSGKDVYNEFCHVISNWT